MKKKIKLIGTATMTAMCLLFTACGNTSTTADSEEDAIQADAPADEGHVEAPDGEAPGKPPEGGGGFGGGSNSEDIDYKGAVEITSSDTQDGQTYDSTSEEESALLISTADDVAISNGTVSKTGDSDGGDNCNFYGLNAAVLVKDGSTTPL